jgi:NitT/TauT family transport system substrate-binding protein
MSSRRTALAAIAAAGALALTACGGGSTSGAEPTSGAGAGSSSASGDGELRQVSVGLMPIAPSVAFEYGIKEGIFEEHGFEVDTSSSVSGTATLPAVSTGQIHFDIGNPMSVGIAVDEGLGLKIVNGFGNSYAEGDDIAGVVVKKGSGIESWGDLQDKTTSVVSLKGHNTLTMQDVAQQDGADPEKLKFTELQFGDMATQLERGNVDAIFVPEPFLSQALANPDNELLGYNFQDSVPGLPTLVTYTSDKLIQEDPELVADFQAAMNDVLAQAQENEADAMALLPDFLGIPEQAAANMRVEEWDGAVKTEQLDQLWELAVQHDYVDAAPEDIYYQP